MKDLRRLRRRLAADAGRLKEINRFLLDPSNPLVEGLLEVVERHGGPEEINRKAREAGKLENLLARLDEERSPVPEGPRLAHGAARPRGVRSAGRVSQQGLRRRRRSGGERVSAGGTVDPARAVTLEISALQFFPWLIAEARQAIERRELMPGRYIRVRRMAEQVADHGDTLAVAAAMRIIGASWVETLDTKGTDGSNVHLGGPETITGYFGGVGEPNDYPLRWIDEYLGYYTRYGIRQVLNVNPGTVLAAYLLHKLGVDCEFKISVFMGNDNPWSVLWTLLTARLFSRPDGSSSLIGFNFSNSVTNDTIRACDRIRASLGLADAVRFEHHITETCEVHRAPALPAPGRAGRARPDGVEHLGQARGRGPGRGGRPRAPQRHPGLLHSEDGDRGEGPHAGDADELPRQARRREPDGSGAAAGRHRRRGSPAPARNGVLSR